METILIIAAVGIMNILCFFLGAKVGQTVSRGEVIETPTVNPFEVYQNHAARKEAEREQKRIDAIMRNIEAFDGTSRGQEDVPRG